MKTIRNDWLELPAGTEKAVKKVYAEFELGVTEMEGLLLGRYDKKIKTVTGTSRNSIPSATKVKVLKRGGINAQIGSSFREAKALAIMEDGRKPGKGVKFNHLKRWAKLKGIPQEAVAPISLKLKRAGSKQWQRGGYKILSKTFSQVDQYYMPMLLKRINKILGEI